MRLPRRPASPEHAVSFAACQLAAQLDARAIVAPAREVAAALAIARLRPRASLVMLVASEPLWRRLAMVRGVAPLRAPEAYGPEAWLATARDWLYARGLARRGDPAVLLHAVDPARSIADSLRTVRLD